MKIVPVWNSARAAFQALRSVRGLCHWYEKWATPRNFLGLLLVFLIFAFWAFPKRNALAFPESGWAAEDGCTLEVPDAKVPPYTPAELTQVLDKLGESERRFYALSELTLDVLFPLVYVTLLGALLVLLARGRPDQPLAYSLAFPALAGCADLAENIGYAAVALGGSPGWAWLGWLGGWGKAIFLLLTFGALALTTRRFLGRLLLHLMVIRVPLLAFVVVNLLWWFAGKPALPTIGNMMVSHGAWGLGTAAFAAVLTTGVIALAGTLAWRLGPERMGFTGLTSPQWVESMPTKVVVTLMPLLSIPMLVRLWQGAEGLPGRALGLGGGLLVATFSLWALKWTRRRGKLQHAANRLIPFLKPLGPGYLEPDTAKNPGQVRRGHPLALGVTTLLTAIFVAGYFWLSPEAAPRTLPTITYVLLLIALLCQVLSGLSFFLDYFRFPLLLGIAVYTLGTNLLFPRTHTFDMRQAKVEPPEIIEAVERRLVTAKAEEDQPVLLTVVGATGGGIQAAAWTVQVLTGLQEQLGPEFTQSIQLISSASGGSVGTLFLMQQLGQDGALPHSRDTLEALRQAAMASSLDATAWGLVFSDFPRAVLPFLPRKNRDRAWAMEQAWLQNLECLRRGHEQKDCSLLPPKKGQEEWLSAWREGAKNGTHPGVIFNATFVEDGEPFLISNLDLRSFSPGPEPVLGEHWRPAPTDFDLQAHYPGLENYDMPVVTAARLSATFPYVTPVARARLLDGSRPLHRWQVSDGGFFDNFGTTAAVRWIQEAVSELQDRRKSVRVLYIQINAFPPQETEPPCSKQNWAQGVLGPIRTIVNVRNSTQRVRNDLELEGLQRSFATPPSDGSSTDPVKITFTAVTFRPPGLETSEHDGVASPPECDTGTRSNPPLSWELSTKDKAQVACDWLSKSNTEAVGFLKKEFFPNSKPIQ
ncbi:MAG: patatin-like phospholipase family protein [Deltaproteobacteria bacterium]|nr:patatin-like phospholipase family protein [Deltaproteobacteria bacterium]